MSARSSQRREQEVGRGELDSQMERTRERDGDGENERARWRGRGRDEESGAGRRGDDITNPISKPREDVSRSQITNRFHQAKQESVSQGAQLAGFSQLANNRNIQARVQLNGIRPMYMDARSTRYDVQCTLYDVGCTTQIATRTWFVQYIRIGARNIIEHRYWLIIN